uniref:CASP-like protein n=1 Tax=Setaria italica TaxID=4555 RepID=K3ZFG8_SETIT
MPGLAGRPGSWGGLVLRVGQAFFAAACIGVMGRYPQLPCGKYELAAAFAFLSWALSATSALIMFWLLAAS